MSTGAFASWAWHPDILSSRCVRLSPPPFRLSPSSLNAVLIGLTTFLLWSGASLAHAQTTSLCTVAWNANTETALAGYKIYHSKTSGVYGSPAQVTGLRTESSCEQIGISAGDNATHYFVVTAYTSTGQESARSAEVSKYLSGPPGCVRFKGNGTCRK
jgi:hypothetical protein